MDFWIKFALSTAVTLFYQFVKNPESARKYLSVLENIYRQLEFLLQALGSTAVNEPLITTEQTPHPDVA